MGLLNWFRGMTCPSPTGHKAVMRYKGMMVIGYVCPYCKYQWYEDRSNR